MRASGKTNIHTRRALSPSTSHATSQRYIVSRVEFISIHFAVAVVKLDVFICTAPGQLRSTHIIIVNYDSVNCVNSLVRSLAPTIRARLPINLPISRRDNMNSEQLIDIVCSSRVPVLASQTAVCRRRPRSLDTRYNLLIALDSSSVCVLYVRQLIDIKIIIMHNNNLFSVVNANAAGDRRRGHSGGGC